MQLKSGQTILLKHTRERARVIQALEHGQWMVEAEMDRDRFPVHEDDIEPLLNTPVSSQTKSQQASGELLLYPSDESQVQLAFVPVGELDYSGYLLNFSSESLVFSAHLISNKGQQWSKHGILAPTHGLELGFLYRDLLNENAYVEIQSSRKASTGTDSKQSKIVKLKPKLFHKNTKAVSWFPEEVSLFNVFAKAKLIAKTSPSLKEYTKQHAPKVPVKKQVLKKYGVNALAEFKTELDLHIEKLTDAYENMSASEIIDLQLRHLDNYLDAAIRIGVERVFIIHGNGKGALRNRIHAKLSLMGDLERYENAYHPKYGFGATEIVLRA